MTGRPRAPGGVDESFRETPVLAIGTVGELSSLSVLWSPAAILLQVSDISEASGLDPGSLQRAMAAPGARGAEGQLARSLGLRPSRALASDAGGP